MRHLIRTKGLAIMIGLLVGSISTVVTAQIGGVPVACDGTNIGNYCLGQPGNKWDCANLLCKRNCQDNATAAQCNSDATDVYTKPKPPN